MDDGFRRDYFTRQLLRTQGDSVDYSRNYSGKQEYQPVLGADLAVGKRERYFLI